MELFYLFCHGAEGGGRRNRIPIGNHYFTENFQGEENKTKMRYSSALFSFDFLGVKIRFKLGFGLGFDLGIVLE